MEDFHNQSNFADRNADDPNRQLRFVRAESVINLSNLEQIRHKSFDGFKTLNGKKKDGETMRQGIEDQIGSWLKRSTSGKVTLKREKDDLWTWAKRMFKRV